jgi:hypothetical protein
VLIGRLGPREGYQLLDIRVFPPASAGEPYPVELSAPGWREFPARRLALDLVALAALNADAAAYGRALGGALFGDDCLGPSYREALAAVQGRGGGLRVRLRLDPPELEAVHWERLYQPIGGGWQPLATTAATPLSRYVTTERWQRPSAVTGRPLRALALIASPADLESYGLDPIAEDERRALHDSLAALPDVTVRYLESGAADRPTLARLRAALTEGCDLIHVLCHGALTEAGTVLYLEREDGRTDPVAADRLVSCFNVLERPPALCFLAACESARRGRSAAFVPLGPALIADGGVQAVVAMSASVGVPTARAFADQFYARLLKHGVVDLAASEARVQVQESWDWGVPVLLSRLPDNQLLDFPIGRTLDESLRHNDAAFAAADRALVAVRGQADGQELVSDLQRLIAELSKSHKVLIDKASDFRDVGEDPATFADRFGAFRREFKRYYDAQDWVAEETSSQAIAELGARLLPALQPLLDADTFQQLRGEVLAVGDAEGALVASFRGFLDSMDAAVEQVQAHVRAGEIADAVEAKLDFEAQISPSARRSREMFQRMTSSVRSVQAA